MCLIRLDPRHTCDASLNIGILVVRRKSICGQDKYCLLLTVFIRYAAFLQVSYIHPQYSCPLKLKHGPTAGADPLLFSVSAPASTEGLTTLRIFPPLIVRSGYVCVDVVVVHDTDRNLSQQRGQHTEAKHQFKISIAKAKLFR